MTRTYPSVPPRRVSASSVNDPVAELPSKNVATVMAPPSSLQEHPSSPHHLYEPTILRPLRVGPASLRGARGDGSHQPLEPAPSALAPSQSGRPDSNRGPPAPKAGALPDCATPRRCCATGRYTKHLNQPHSKRCQNLTGERIPQRPSIGHQAFESSSDPEVAPSAGPTFSDQRTV